MNFDEAGGTLDQVSMPWNPVQSEINKRVQAKLGTYRQLGWQAAYAEVMEEDPSLAQRNNDAIQVEVNRRTKEMMKVNPSLDYYSALQAVFRADTLLYREYQKANALVTNILGVNVGRQKNLQQVDSQIGTLVDEKVKASEGQMTYQEAWRIVLTDRPDLAGRFKDAW